MPIFSQFGKLMSFTQANVSARGLAQLKDTPQLTSVFLQKKKSSLKKPTLSKSVNTIQGRPQSAIS